MCFIIFSKFGDVFSLSFLVHTDPTNSEGFTVLFSSNSKRVNCLANSIGCNYNLLKIIYLIIFVTQAILIALINLTVNIPHSSSGTFKCHSIGGGDLSKLKVMGRCSEGSHFLCTIFITESTHFLIDFPLTVSRNNCNLSKRFLSRSKS